VRINADLLHFHSTPSALESSIGGFELIGVKVAAQASVRNAIVSKGRFIAVLLFPVLQISAAFFPVGVLLTGVGFSLSSQGRVKGFVQWNNCFVTGWPTKPLHKSQRNRKE
jgi:hypothetical protein